MSSDSYPGCLNQLPSGSWRWRVSIDGERHSFTWQDVDEAEAEKRARQKYDDLADRVNKGTAGTTPISRFIERFRRDEVSQLAESSQASYNYSLDAMRTYFVDLGPDPALRDVSRGDVKRFLYWRRKHGPDGAEKEEELSPYTLKVEHAVIRRLLGHAFDLELIEGNPAARVDSPKVEEREPVLLSDEQLDNLLGKLDDPMAEMYVLLLAETGVRSRSEALHIRWGDVDLEEGFLHVRSGQDGHKTKSGKGRYVPLTARVRAALREYMADYRMLTYNGERSPWLFHSRQKRKGNEAGDRRKTFQHIVQKAAAKADIPDEWRIHDLRHRRCTRWLAEGHSPEKVRRAMGHSSLETTLKYSHLVKRDLRSMVEEEKRALADLGS